ncbi:MAG: hypothetical protein ACXW3L_01415, partial [Limisphaerales bacterium]
CRGITRLAQSRLEGRRDRRFVVHSARGQRGAMPEEIASLVELPRDPLAGEPLICEKPETGSWT